MPSFSTSAAVLTIAIILFLAQPAHAFGAGNIASIAKIEGLNWRHGDIEDTLLNLVMSRAAGGKKFDKMMVARVYFGNWLRDYSQAIDVGTVKYVSAEAIRILLWVLGFMTFGYGTKEFEVTADRLGCYRPEDHIDNPKDYADNLDATQYDRRLRGPVNERVELAIDPKTGLKNYIANEQAGCMTSAKHVRRLFTESIRLGRSYNRTHNKAELYEALRLMGTGLHCLEDFSAHSNYSELCLIEMGERDVFPHVGRQTQIRLQGAQHPVFPIITGTFGGVDFLHSVVGELDDKATQSEIQELEGTMQSGGNSDTSVFKNLLSSIPSGLFGDNDQAGKADELQANATAAQMSNMRVSPLEPEAFTQQANAIVKQIYPIMQWHDEILQSITEAIEQIPVLPELIEQFQEQLNVFVFSLLAPFVLPIINQIKTELNTGSSEIIQSSKDKQLIVFNDDHSSDPTHSMISKDHFSNILNEPAGKVASQVLKWVVPQLIQCWDDERVDVDRTINRIINGVFHHPALRTQGEDGAAEGRKLMFSVIENWWRSHSQSEQQDLRRKLSRDGVLNGENHKEGVHDSGHGCGKPLTMNKSAFGGASGGAAGGLIGGLGAALGGGSSSGGGFGGSGGNSGIGKFAEEAAGGGALGGLLGVVAGGLGGSLLAGLGGKEKVEDRTYGSAGYTPEGGYKQQYTEVAHGGNQYAQAKYSETELPGGGRQTDYQRFEQTAAGSANRYEQRTETKPEYGPGYEQTTESWEAHKKQNSGEDSDGSGYKKHGKHHKKKGHGSQEGNERTGGFGGGGYGEPARERFEEPPRQEYGGRSGFGGEPPRQEFGGRGGGYGENRGEYGGGRGGFGGGFEEQPQTYGRQTGGSGYGESRGEYGGGRGGFGGGYEAPPPREEYGGRGGFGENRNEYGRGRGGFGGGYEAPPPREEYGGRGSGFGENSNEYGRGRGGFGGGYEAPPPGEEYGGRGGGFGESRGEYGGGRGGFGSGFEEQPQIYGRQAGGGGYGESRGEYGGRGGFGGGFEEPPRQGYGEQPDYGQGNRGGDDFEEEVSEERQNEHQRERRGERSGGGWFS